MIRVTGALKSSGFVELHTDQAPSDEEEMRRVCNLCVGAAAERAFRGALLTHQSVSPSWNRAISMPFKSAEGATRQELVQMIARKRATNAAWCCS